MPATTPPQPLWSLTLSLPIAKVEGAAQWLADEAISVSTFVPPRKKMGSVEALFNQYPDRAALTAKFIIWGYLHKIKTPKFKIREIPDLNWLEKVSQDYPPLKVAQWTVHTSQQKHAVVGVRQTIEIDGTTAFGTGEHPTTRGCLLLLNRLLKKYQFTSALDLGCGTGILALAYAKTARMRTTAVDCEKNALGVARENVKVNGLSAYIKIGWSEGFRSRIVKEQAPYDLILANIFAGPLARMAYEMRGNLLPGGCVILAGLLNSQAARVLRAYQTQGFCLLHRLTLGEWTILALKHSSKA